MNRWISSVISPLPSRVWIIKLFEQDLVGIEIIFMYCSLNGVHCYEDSVVVNAGSRTIFRYLTNN